MWKFFLTHGGENCHYTIVKKVVFWLSLPNRPQIRLAKNIKSQSRMWEGSIEGNLGGQFSFIQEAKITKMRYHIKPYIFLFCFVWRYSIIIYLERWNVICGILLTHQIPPVSVNITVGPNFLKILQKREYNIIFTDQNITETIFKKNVRFPFYKSFLAIFGKKIDF